MIVIKFISISLFLAVVFLLLTDRTHEEPMGYIQFRNEQLWGLAREHNRCDQDNQTNNRFQCRYLAEKQYFEILTWKKQELGLK